MTLVEMLVATALSLLIVLAVTQVFRLVGDNVLSSRAVAEMSSQLRATSNQLRSDLSQLTVPVRPWTDYDSGQGYFEYHEGRAWDMGDGAGNLHSETSIETSIGDYDDILMFTAKARGTPFTGQVAVGGDTAVIESNVAEIAWFTSFNDRNGNNQVDPGEIALHRRVLLVKPELNRTHADGQPILSSDEIAGPHELSFSDALTRREFYHLCDISVGYRPRFNDAGEQVGWIRFANSLQNLSLRENRTAHLDIGSGYLQQFPYLLTRQRLAPQGTNVTDGVATPIDKTPVALADAYGKDVILSQLLAFDVQAYDPDVVIQKAEVAPSSPSVSTPDYESVLPDDPGYGNKEPVGRGGYVDLFYARYASGPSSSIFSGPPRVRSGLQRQPLVDSYATYDTWTMFYEHDSVNQNNLLADISNLSRRPSADWGTDGIDNDGVGGVDDIGERETSPPYPVPLRGIQVRLRISDPDSRQVRQVTVSSDFIPE